VFDSLEYDTVKDMENGKSSRSSMVNRGLEHIEMNDVITGVSDRRGKRDFDHHDSPLKDFQRLNRSAIDSQPQSQHIVPVAIRNVDLNGRIRRRA
jgi:hypothetical protein